MDLLATAAPSPDESEPPSPGELIVENGRLAGTRCPLNSPLTLIGQGDGCEIRLNFDGILSVHCVVARGPEGFVLRDLGGPAGTQVNGEPVASRVLHPGDRIGVGPFLFRLEFKPPLDVNGLEAERDALRVQAAAVVAQQAALTEEELRLGRQAAALEREEQQLAAHLEEQQARLVELRGQLKQDRAALKEERAALREQEGQARNEAIRERKQARKERRRFVELRKRQKRRWDRQWGEKEAELHRLGEELAAQRERLGEEAECLRREREDLGRRQLQFNGECELGRRKLREAWEELQLSQQRWEETLNQEQAERARRGRALAAAEQSLAEERRRWRRQREELAREVEGLETRLRNQRLRLADQEHRLAHAEALLQARPEEPAVSLQPPQQPPAGPPCQAPQAPGFLRRLAGDLTDQRRRLLEQWQRLLQVEAQWQQDRNRVVAELERAAHQLGLRERRADQQEQALAELESELHQRREAQAHSRRELEAGHARLCVREAEWEAERGALLTGLRAREEAVAGRAQRLEGLRRRRSERRRIELEELRLARERLEELCRQYLGLVADCQERRVALARERRALASEAVAMERFRLAYLGRLRNTAAAERRLERLRRRAAARLEAAERELAAERAALQAETARLDDRAALLFQQENALAARQGEWQPQEADLEERHLAGRDAEERQRQEAERWRVRYEYAGQQLAALRDEVERLARLLLDEGETEAAGQAA
jgi:hypothetical protein